LRIIRYKANGINIVELSDKQRAFANGIFVK